MFHFRKSEHTHADLNSFSGSGIFISPKGVLLGTGSVGLCLVAWGVSAVISFCGKSIFIQLIVVFTIIVDIIIIVVIIVVLALIISYVLFNISLQNSGKFMSVFTFRSLSYGGIGTFVAKIWRPLHLPSQGVWEFPCVYGRMGACSRYNPRVTTGEKSDSG